jgi:hypothetical protein
VLPLAQTHGQTADPRNSAETAKTAEQGFKNIQALDGTPADQVIGAMQFISNSLGVECEFCHVLDRDLNAALNIRSEGLKIILAAGFASHSAERPVGEVAKNHSTTAFA